MNLQPSYLYAQGGIALFVIGFYALIVYPHLLRKILALNIMSSGALNAAYFLPILHAAWFKKPCAWSLDKGRQGGWKRTGCCWCHRCLRQWWWSLSGYSPALLSARWPGFD